MVSPAGSVPFSYLDVLQGTPGATLPQTTVPAAPAPAAAPTTPATTDTTDSLASRLGLSSEILNILQGNDGSSSTPATNNPLAALFGDSDQPSASDLLSQIYGKLLSASATSATLQTASQNAVAKQTAANLQTDPLDKILADFNTAQNLGNEFLNPPSTTVST